MGVKIARQQKWRELAMAHALAEFKPHDGELFEKLREMSRRREVEKSSH